jgi:hypothetical protein
VVESCLIGSCIVFGSNLPNQRMGLQKVTVCRKQLVLQSSWCACRQTLLYFSENMSTEGHGYS